MKPDEDRPPSPESAEELLRRIESHLAAIRQAQETAASDWLTITEAARVLRVSRDTIERLIGSGQLRAVAIHTRTGSARRRRYRIKRAWIEEYLLGQCDDISRSTPEKEPLRYDGPDYVG